MSNFWRKVQYTVHVKPIYIDLLLLPANKHNGPHGHDIVARSKKFNPKCEAAGRQSRIAKSNEPN